MSIEQSNDMQTETANDMSIDQSNDRLSESTNEIWVNYLESLNPNCVETLAMKHFAKTLGFLYGKYTPKISKIEFYNEKPNYIKRILKENNKSFLNPEECYVHIKNGKILSGGKLYKHYSIGFYYINPTPRSIHNKYIEIDHTDMCSCGRAYSLERDAECKERCGVVKSRQAIRAMLKEWAGDPRDHRGNY